jgi:hypothetical protein
MRALRELLNIFQTSAKLKRVKHPRIVEGDGGPVAHQSTIRAYPSGLATRGPEGR